jgi:hypothetical protein
MMMLVPISTRKDMLGAGQIQNPPWMENRLPTGTAASGWAMVLPNSKRLVLLNVAPPPATTLREMAKRLLLCANVPQQQNSPSKAKSACLIGHLHAA